MTERAEKEARENREARDVVERVNAALDELRAAAKNQEKN